VAAAQGSGGGGAGLCVAVAAAGRVFMWWRRWIGHTLKIFAAVCGAGRELRRGGMKILQSSRGPHTVIGSLMNVLPCIFID
jgi:hypothetical protein